ncbi:hypothetical protein B0H16DRAFT_1705716, partial [Mycena metata]
MHFFNFVLAAMTLASASSTPIVSEDPALAKVATHIEANNTPQVLASEGYQGHTAEHDTRAGWDTRWGVGLCAGVSATQGCYFANGPVGTCVKAGSGTFASKSFVIYGDITCTLYTSTVCSGSSYVAKG